LIRQNANVKRVKTLEKLEEVPEAWFPLKKYLPPKNQWPDFVWRYDQIPELRLYPHKMNLGRIFVDDNARRFPNKVAILYEDQRITYGELERLVNRLGNGLKGLGVTENERVAIMMPNCPEWLITTLACWKLGALVILMNHLFRTHTIEYIANDSEAKVIVADYDTVDTVLKARDRLKTVEHIVTVGCERKSCLPYEDFTRKESAKLEPADTTRHQFARLIYTSGTTGEPKGVLRTYDQVLATCDTHAKYNLRVTRDDVVGGHPFFSFAYGSINFTFEPWRCGAAVSIIRNFTPEEQWELVEKHGITVLYAVPTAFKMLLRVGSTDGKRDLGSLRLAQSAGDILPAEITREWRRKFPGVELVDCLGSSELDYWLSTHENWPESKIGSIGYPVLGVESKIIDQDGSECKPGEIGELVVRGYTGNLYWRRPDKQRESVIDGWNRMGLYALLDEDGCFWLKGRTITLIKSSGYSIVGQEVAACLLGHSAVQDCGVVGSPDPLRGQIVKAYVILNKEYKASEELKKELQDYVRQRIEPYKYARIIEFVDELPRTATGKVDIVALGKTELEKHEA
jgi:2-aminobenzoate-CoA ligase